MRTFYVTGTILRVCSVLSLSLLGKQHYLCPFSPHPLFSGGGNRTGYPAVRAEPGATLCQFAHKPCWVLYGPSESKTSRQHPLHSDANAFYTLLLFLCVLLKSEALHVSSHLVLNNHVLRKVALSSHFKNVETES